MGGLATQETDLSVDEYINRIDNKSKQEEARVLLKLLEDVSGFKPKVWGDYFIIGYGNYSYSRKGGKEVFEWFRLGFAARKTKITLYLTYDISQYQELLDRLGKCKWGKGCLYINKLADVNLDVLREMVEKSKESGWHQ